MTQIKCCNNCFSTFSGKCTDVDSVCECHKPVGGLEGLLVELADIRFITEPNAVICPRCKRIYPRSPVKNSFQLNTHCTDCKENKSSTYKHNQTGEVFMEHEQEYHTQELMLPHQYYQLQVKDLVAKAYTSGQQDEREKVRGALDAIQIVDPPKDVERLDKQNAFLAGQMNMLMRIKLSSLSKTDGEGKL